VRLPPRIVHLGLGAFARAHLGEYTADAGEWGICGVAPHSRSTVDALRARGGRYTLITRAERDTPREIGVFVEALHAPTERAAVLAAIAAADIVTLTVTEKAYREDAEVIGLLREGLERRDKPATVLSLDNLPRNGAVLERLVGAPGHRFPCSMVDRVVPAATDADRALAGDPAVAEPFRQWVLEDFDGPRPDWDALFVASSAPHEALKLRLLNGTHSLLAYLGPRLGARTVADAWAIEELVAVADQLAEEDLVPTLPEIPGIDVGAYRAELSHRWSNPRIEHQLAQIALDGDRKLPARFAEPARRRVATGHPPRWIALALAAYDNAEAILDRFPDELRPLVTEWRERFAADGVSSTLKNV
jgi:fructuronate reductase